MVKATQAGWTGLRCLRCGAADQVTLGLDDLETIHCYGCEEDYPLSEVQDTIDQWALVLAWRDAAPPRRAASEATLKLPHERA